ncbi:MAG: ATPase [Elusimicrobia bacterium CG03_land_8_20_14_0_80_50_18]|nr:MAG: ATPase [Elusimicrobia bacterium CG03_land_8_20_14_0_80_50_18]
MIKRDIFKDIEGHLGQKEITLIAGPRQVGKTTLMLLLKERLDKKGEQSVFLNLDYEADSGFFRSQEVLLKKLDLELGRKKALVFIDEIQRKENAGVFLKGIYDLNLPYKFIVSGSGSLELKEKIHESLAGRKRVFELNPVSFNEFVNYTTGYKYEKVLQSFFSMHREKVNVLLMEYLNFGGYPRVILETRRDEKRKIINEIYRSYVEKDIVYLLKIDRPDAYDKLLKILSAGCGQIVRYCELAAKIGISVPTVKKYLWYAEKTFAIKMVTPYFGNKGKEVVKSPVSYFIDSGLRNYILGVLGNVGHFPETGFSFQNFIFNILREKYLWSNYSLHYWRTLDKAEVDFVLEKGRTVIPVEVKFSNLKTVSVPRSMRSFIEKYKPKEAWIVNLDYTGEIKIAQTLVKIFPFYALSDMEFENQ